MLHQPFKLILSINTPIVIKDFAPTLDGLLFDAVRTRYPNNSVEDSLKVLEGLLSVTRGLFHASSAQLAVSLDVGVVANKVTRVRSSGHRNLSSDWFSPNGAKGKYVKVLSIGGKFKSRIQSHNAYGVKQLVFFGRGDIKGIETILTHCVLGVGFGANGSVQGQIGGFVIAPMESDYSFMHNGNLNRSIPIDLAHEWGIKSGNITESLPRPPYFLKENRIKSFSPEPIRHISV